MKHRPTVSVVVATLIAAVAVFIAGGLAGSSQWACNACHGGFARSQRETAHKATRCLACHAPGIAGRLEFGTKVVLTMEPAKIMGRGVAGPVSETPRAACIRCHAAVVRSGVVEKDGLRIDHSTCALDPSCDACHSTVAHGDRTRWKRSAQMEGCIACHTMRGASLECDACHAEKSTAQRVAVGAWQVTHGVNWERTHGMGQLGSCVGCHPKDYCARCHKTAVPHDAAFGAQHGLLAISDRRACLVCHKTESFCDACHGIAMPHPTGFIKTHSAVAGDFEAPVCRRCHSRETCDRCHVAHVHPGLAGVGRNPSSAGTGSP
ncbi:MAG: hypothetical protein LLG08_03135 [Actinomycetia bacterium]|nr:hypothetical protein [Actinomycetes bacterium]